MEYFISIILILFSALFSGLTLGFFSLNRDDLERKAKLGDPQALKVYGVRKNGNLLLCTLLVGNVLVNSALSIFLGSVASGAVALVISTSLIVIFGEIVPQSIFSRYGLFLGAKFSGLVRIFILLFYVVSWPIAKVLDAILGNEMSTVYSKKELMKIIEEHEDSVDSEIDRDEEKILKGALSFSEKTVENIMTPRPAVFALEQDQKFDAKIFQKIFKSGHSRIPVYEKDLDKIVGILYVKELILREKRLGSIKKSMHTDVTFVDEDERLDNLLNLFRKTKHHLFIVQDQYGVLAGIVSIEDVIEEILGMEIVDEFDRYIDLQKFAKDKFRQGNKLNKKK